MFETIIMPILTLLIGGGLATFITLKATRRTANANADQAEVQARAEEFHLLKEQIELNQQQNLDLTKSNNGLVEQVKEMQSRFVEQTELLRSTQSKLLKSEEDKMKLVHENGNLKVELAKKKCEDLPCPFRLPPNAYTPPRPDITNEQYHAANEKKGTTGQKNKTAKEKQDNDDNKEELQK